MFDDLYRSTYLLGVLVSVQLRGASGGTSGARELPPDERRRKKASLVRTLAEFMFISTPT